MIKLVFIGDEPSKFNTHADVPFVGAKCFPTLVKWIAIIKPDYYMSFNSIDLYYNDDRILELWRSGFKILVLGKRAESKINDLNLSHCSYILPHPSGLNRKLNDKAYVNRMLVEVYKYVRE